MIYRVLPRLDFACNGGFQPVNGGKGSARPKAIYLLIHWNIRSVTLPFLILRPQIMPEVSERPCLVAPVSHVAIV